MKNKSDDKLDCDVLKLSSIKKKCKRYDQEANNQKIHHSSKNKFKFNACTVHPGFDLKQAIFDLNKPKTFISFICFLIQFKFKLLNIEDTNQ